MTLAFMTNFNNGKPTYFVEKIWESILRNHIEMNLNEFIEHGRKSLPKNYTIGTHKPKIHTIRKDGKNRWKVGNNIHFVINNRTPKRYQFAPVINVVSVQKIEISFMMDVIVDGKELTFKEIQTLAFNDGFESVESFFEWFSDDFVGHIIHWTKFRY